MKEEVVDVSLGEILFDELEPFNKIVAGLSAQSQLELVTSFLELHKYPRSPQLLGVEKVTTVKLHLPPFFLEKADEGF